jgi:hypothetical protein
LWVDKMKNNLETCWQMKNSDGIFFYNEKGERHREDGPACEYVNGSREWFLNGKPHRVGGPACEYAGVFKSWWLNGRRHREDGPAIEWSNGKKQWWLNGLKLSEEEFKLKMNAKEYPKKEVTSEGTVWRNERGELHREDGPAIERANGNKFWYLNGKPHRVGGPACEYAGVFKSWWLNGRRHREDGPACGG